MPKQLYAMSDLALILEVSKQAVFKAVKDGRIEEADYITKGVLGWTPDQVEKIKKSYVRRNL
jgi:hypothetical protein